jgi:hypothetical protein
MDLERDDHAAGMIRRLSVGLWSLSGLASADEVSKRLQRGSPFVLHSLVLWPILTPQEGTGVERERSLFTLDPFSATSCWPTKSTGFLRRMQATG